MSLPHPRILWSAAVLLLAVYLVSAWAKKMGWPAYPDGPLTRRSGRRR